MALSIRDIIVNYIDDALDIDDLENIGEYVRAILTAEALADWQLRDSIRLLHTDLTRMISQESNVVRRVRLKASLSYFEADFLEFLVATETESLPGRSEHP